MIGIDIVSIKRVEKILSRNNSRFLDKIMTEREVALHTSSKPQTIAGIFSAKESISKALGCGIGEHLTFHDMEITKSDLGAPKVTLSDKVKNHFKIKDVAISITHDGDFAASVAYVVFE